MSVSSTARCCQVFAVKLNEGRDLTWRCVQLDAQTLGPATLRFEPGISPVRPQLKRAGCAARWPRPSRWPSCTGRSARSTALGTAAVARRFAENEVLRILAHQVGHTVNTPAVRASETDSLQPGTAAWSGFGVTEPFDPAPLDPAMG